VEVLRGSRGAEFEGVARIIRGESWGINCGGCFGMILPGSSSLDDDELADKHLLIKGPYCFVFYDDDASSPKYAIPLAHTKAIVLGGDTNHHHRNKHKGRTVVTLERKKTGDVEYEISFATLVVAKSFRDAVAKQAALARAEKVAQVCLLFCDWFWFFVDVGCAMYIYMYSVSVATDGSVQANCDMFEYLSLDLLGPSW
jgi:hypothetical protein